MEQHELLMQRCLQLAACGLGTTYPNPLVGSVLVAENKIVGEGWHRKAGEPHAEILAMRSVSDVPLSACTLYVNLEPCNHYGKTPPCAQAIISVGIRKVVIGAKDSHALVDGSGIHALRAAGIEVITGVLDAECRNLNRRFYTFHEKKRPYIILKWAESADGYISPRDRSEQQPVFLSGETSRQLVHKWRIEEPAILVGTQTVFDDNPFLNARSFVGNQPLRCVIDRHKRINPSANVYSADSPTITFVDANPREGDVVIPFENLPLEIAAALYDKSLQSVIIEGGRATLQSFIDAGLWDEARIFKCPVTCGDGTRAPFISGELTTVRSVGRDQLLTLRN